MLARCEPTEPFASSTFAVRFAAVMWKAAACLTLAVNVAPATKAGDASAKLLTEAMRRNKVLDALSLRGPRVHAPGRAFGSALTLGYSRQSHESRGAASLDGNVVPHPKVVPLAFLMPEVSVARNSCSLSTVHGTYPRP